MKVSLLVPDASANNMVRTFPIAKVLERRFHVEVVGPEFGDGVFPPYRGELNYRTFPARADGSFASVRGDILRAIDGDVAYAFKPLPTSFGIGLDWKRETGRPLALDVEDWEVGGILSVDNRLLLGPYLAKEWWKRRHDPRGDYVRLRALERRAREADAVFVVSERLRELFGGVKLPHGADAREFDPARFDREALRAAQGYGPDDLVVLFSGTPRPHKGVTAILEAMRAEPRARLLVVGGRADDAYVRELSRASDRVRVLPPRPHHEMPSFLALADCVLLPQRDTPFTRAQVPGKVFEAMMMGKAVVATGVSDLPEILSGCGIVVPVGERDGFARALQELAGDAELRRALGERARARAVERYSWDAMERVLVPAFERLMR